MGDRHADRRRLQLPQGSPEQEDNQVPLQQHTHGQAGRYIYIRDAATGSTGSWVQPSDKLDSYLCRHGMDTLCWKASTGGSRQASYFVPDEGISRYGSLRSGTC